MNASLNDCVMNIATVNGSGSQSSNNIILKTLFRMGIPVGGKNLFPSNIAGLPTWFTIRINKDGFTARKIENDIVVAMNLDTIPDDIKGVRAGGVFMYNGDLKFDPILLRKDVTNIAVPFRTLVDTTTDQIRIKKLLTNMVYVGILAEAMNLDPDCLASTVRDQFGEKKTSVLEVNMKAIAAGAEWAKENIPNFPHKVRSMNENRNKIIVDGNTAAALGMVFGGCTVLSWYPITPSSSVAENFQKYAEKYRRDASGKRTFAVIQAEDELSAMGMVIGAGWAGARAMTATSGPGISLMAEFAGYSYFAEIPAVIWDIQRVGPSTGLPTRTMQGDLLSAYTLSHGDTKHPVLLPGTPNECFEYGQLAFDYAERFQTLVFVLSDLDLGMNFWICDDFKYPEKPLDRGKVLSKEDLDKGTPFMRYKDVDGDGIPYRTLPGTHHLAAAYFTRGSGHNEKAAYTERPEDYQNLMDRLDKKFSTFGNLLPSPELVTNPSAQVGILAFGSSHFPMHEALTHLQSDGVPVSYLRVKALPFADEVRIFLETYDRIYIVEQNRDAQMRSILTMSYPHHAAKFRSILHYDGMPLYAAKISAELKKQEHSHTPTPETMAAR